MLLIYEFFFNGIFKLIYREVDISKINTGAPTNFEKNGDEDIQKVKEDTTEFNASVLSTQISR